MAEVIKENGTYSFCALDVAVVRRDSSLLVPNLLATSLTLFPTLDVLALASDPAPTPLNDALTDGLAECDAAVVLPVALGGAVVVADVLGVTPDRRSLIILLLDVLGPEDVEDRSKDVLLLVAEVVFAPRLGFDTEDRNADLLFSSALADIDEQSRSCPVITLVLVRLAPAGNGGLVGGLLRLLLCVCRVLAVVIERETTDEATAEALEVIGALVDVDFVVARGRLAEFEAEFTLRSGALLLFVSVDASSFVGLEDCAKSISDFIAPALPPDFSMGISSLNKFS